VISKVLSLDAHDADQLDGTPGIGSRKDIFTLKTLLHTTMLNHNLSTVTFIDLVKAYDTAGYELLVEVLEVYGIHPNICDVGCSEKTLH
jgi:hypothetical protein